MSQFAPVTRSHAVVIGGSLGGLVTARVLSDHFERVTIIERDPVTRQPSSRKGQPQTRHLHGLLAGGFNILSHYFPSLPASIVDQGAFVDDFARGMRWFTCGGYRKSIQAGFKGALVSRTMLEHLVRECVLALPNVTLLDQHAVANLLAGPGNRQVLGVAVERHDGSTETRSILADLVVDASGRGSRSPQWLKDLGYEAPSVSEVKVNVGYATRIFRRDPVKDHEMIWYLNTPDAPRETRFGGMFPVDGERWIVSTGGWHGDHPPLDEAGFMAFLSALPCSDIYELASRSEPLSEIIAHKFPASIRRHYDQLAAFPTGYLVLGDAHSSFNPTYGQGMTSAVMQAVELDQVLRQPVPAYKLANTFFKRAAKVIDTPWQLAVGEDFRFPQTSGPKPAGTDFINSYVSRVHKATQRDESVCLAFLKVMNLMAAPPSLFQPQIALKVMRA